MDNRKYNLFFHLHTVSGISVTVMLFVIFFAGAFTLFQEEINEWEKYDGTAAQPAVESGNGAYFQAFEKVKKTFPDTYGRNVSIYRHDGAMAINVSPSPDSLIGKKRAAGGEFIYHEETHTFSPHGEYYGTGTLLYWLHFYWQFGQVGYLIAGFVSLFFFLAIVTGVLIHWKKIVSNFFVFRPFAKWKTIWTDAHTALGVIGLPFQFLYALTGCIFGLGLLLSWTVAVSFFDSDVDKFYRDYYFGHQAAMGKPEKQDIDLAYYVEQTEKKWGEFELSYISITNMDSDSARIELNGNLPVKEEFLGFGQIVYDISSGKVVHEQDPRETNYIDNSRNWIFKVHYAKFGDIGTFGNTMVKTAYFLLALLSCFVIITGVMIWLTARDKKGLDPKKKRWNNGVGYFYLASCLSMFPLVGYTMIVSRWSETHTENHLNYVFFSMWLVATILLAMLKDNRKIFRFTLLSGGIFSLLVPVSAFVSGGGMFKAFSSGHTGVFSVDILFTLLAAAAFFNYWRVKVAEKRRTV